MREREKTYNREQIKLFLKVYFLILIVIAFFRFPDIKNEMKYLVIAKEMLQDKSYFILKYFGEIYPDKPPVYFWGIGFFMRFFQSEYYPLSLIFGGVAFLYLQCKITYDFFKKMWNKDMALEVFILQATLPFLFGVSLVLRMDMMMSCCILISIYSFFNIYYKKVEITKWNIIKIYLFIILGVFIKGFAALLIPISTILFFLILEKNIEFLKKIKFLQGILGCIGAILGILVLISFISQDINYLNLLFGQEIVGRVVKSKSHIRPFYFYIKNLLYTTLPIMPFLFIGFYKKVKKIKRFKGWKPIDKIIFSILIPNLVLFSLISGKLDIYLLPLYPAMIIIAARYIEVAWTGKKIKIYRVLSKIGIVAMIISGVMMPWYNENYTLKPIINHLEGSPRIYSYKFKDSRNLKIFLDSEIINLDNIESVKNKEEAIFLTRKKEYLELIDKNAEKVFENKKYIIFMINN